jgi:hypothetical protein
MNHIPVTIAGQVLNEEQAHALRITVDHSMLRLNLWLQGCISEVNADFPPRQETIDHFLRHVELINIFDPAAFAKRFTKNRPFTLVNGVATYNETLEVVVERYNANNAAWEAAKKKS